MVRIQSYFAGIAADLGIGSADQALERGFVFGRQCRCDEIFLGDESDLIAGNERQLLRHAGVDLVADHEEAEFLGLTSYSSDNRAEEYPVEAAIVVPPGGVVALLNGSLQIALGGFGRPAGIGNVESDNLLVRLGQDEKIAACQLPERRGAVLDGGCVLRRHHGLQGWQIREHGSRAGKLAFTLTLYALERAHGGLGADPDLAIGFDADGMPDDKQQSARQRANGKKRGDEELRSQAEMRHGASTRSHCGNAVPLDGPGTNL